MRRKSLPVGKKSLSLSIPGNQGRSFEFERNGKEKSQRMFFWLKSFHSYLIDLDVFSINIELLTMWLVVHKQPFVIFQLWPKRTKSEKWKRRMSFGILLQKHIAHCLTMHNLHNAPLLWAKRTPDRGVEPLTLRLKVARSTNWANQASLLQEIRHSTKPVFSSERRTDQE